MKGRETGKYVGTSYRTLYKMIVRNFCGLWTLKLKYLSTIMNKLGGMRVLSNLRVLWMQIDFVWSLFPPNFFLFLIHIRFFFFLDFFFFFDVDHLKSLYWIGYSVAFVLFFSFLAMRHMRFQLPDQRLNPHRCIGKQSLNNWTAPEVPPYNILIIEVMLYQWKLYKFLS